MQQIDDSKLSETNEPKPIEQPAPKDEYLDHLDSYQTVYGCGASQFPY